MPAVTYCRSTPSSINAWWLIAAALVPICWLALGAWWLPVLAAFLLIIMQRSSSAARWTTCTRRQLNNEMRQYVLMLRDRHGVGRGARVLLMVPPDDARLPALFLALTEIHGRCNTIFIC